MKTHNKVSLAILVLPIITLIISALLMELFECKGMAGSVRCEHIPDSIGGALFGISMVCAFGFPLAIFLAPTIAIIGFIIEKYKKN